MLSIKAYWINYS